ncbi:hypothetical protein HKD37_16G046126 [Glycine soja]
MSRACFVCLPTEKLQFSLALRRACGSLSSLVSSGVRVFVRHTSVVPPSSPSSAGWVFLGPKFTWYISRLQLVRSGEHQSPPAVLWMKDDMGGDAAATESATTEQNATNGEYQNSLFQR